VLVKVFTDAGIIGHAAGHSFVSHIERSVAPYMIGRDPFALEYHHQVLTNAGGPSSSTSRSGTSSARRVASRCTSSSEVTGPG
jgi:L-alanine-DL-glutamate epimerase-like enolase superfamily enzyme